MTDPATPPAEATVDTRGPRPVLRFERVLARPPEAVWRAITDREELKAWFPCDVVADAWEPGAAISFPFPGEGGPTLTGTVLEVEEPRVLAYTWGAETLRFILTPEPDGRTRLVFTDELDPPLAARNAAGWHVCLARLAAESATDAWKVFFDRYTAAFEPALGPQQGPPSGH